MCCLALVTSTKPFFLYCLLFSLLLTYSSLITFTRFDYHLMIACYWLLMIEFVIEYCTVCFGCLLAIIKLFIVFTVLCYTCVPCFQPDIKLSHKLFLCARHGKITNISGIVVCRSGRALRLKCINAISVKGQLLQSPSLQSSGVLLCKIINHKYLKNGKIKKKIHSYSRSPFKNRQKCGYNILTNVT